MLQYGDLYLGVRAGDTVEDLVDLFIWNVWDVEGEVLILDRINRNYPGVS